MANFKVKYAIVMELEGAMDAWTQIDVFDTEKDCSKFMHDEFETCLYHGEPRVVYGDNLVKSCKIQRVFDYSKK